MDLGFGLRISHLQGYTTIAFSGYIGIMEKKIETTIVYWGVPVEAVLANSKSCSTCCTCVFWD